MMTNKAVLRFWSSMGERFGKRWLTEYGEVPTKAWRDVLDRFTPANIADALTALKDRPERERAHPPTLAEFEAILGKAASKAAAGTSGPDFRRAYWRSTVVWHLRRVLCRERGAVQADDLEQYIARHGAVYGGLRQLLDELCDMEAKNQGQRTAGMYTLAKERCEAAVAYDLSQQPTGA